VEQGLAIEEITQSQEGLDGQTWRRRIVHQAARDGIEHPRGDRQRKAIRELDDQTFCGLPS
jgi:hypothetical protein